MSLWVLLALVPTALGITVCVVCLIMTWADRFPHDPPPSRREIDGDNIRW